MMQPIDKKTHMAVDRSSCMEIGGAEEGDLDADTVTVRDATYSGECRRTVHFPAGVLIVRRR